MMRVSIYIAISANGLISNQRDVPDWLSQEYGKGFMEICQRTKAVIMGRKTYEILAPDNLPLKDEGTTIVLTSNTGIEPANPTVMFSNKSAEDVVALLEEKINLKRLSSGVWLL
jgi:dihydrofolate reductase